MAEENGENGSINGDVPEIELIIKVRSVLMPHFKRRSS